MTTANDGKRGYREAAGNVEDTELAQTFREYAQQREQFAEALTAQIQGMGGTPEADTSLLADLHRGWMNLKSAISSGDKAAMVEECLRGDDMAIMRYEEALDDPMPDELRTLIETQLEHIRAARARINQAAMIA